VLPQEEKQRRQQRKGKAGEHHRPGAPRGGGHRLHECTERPVRDASGQLILEVEVPSILGGYRVSSVAQRKLQRVMRGRWLLPPDRRFGAPAIWPSRMASHTQIDQFCALEVDLPHRTMRQ
jgi:hypothetical protein